MFIYSSFFTLKHHPKKRGFYWPFLILNICYLLAVPCTIVFGNHVLDPWVRQAVVLFIEHIAAIVGHLVFIILTRPNAHNKNFPYHVRTTEIGIMEAATENGNTSMMALELQPSSNANEGAGAKS